MGKYRHSRIRQNKPPTSHEKNRPIKNTTHTHKTQYKQNLSHYRAYQNKRRQTNRNAEPKTQTESRRKRFTSSENVRRIYPNARAKRKRPTERKNALQGKKKSRPRKSRTAVLFILLSVCPLSNQNQCHFLDALIMRHLLYYSLLFYR